MPLSNTAKKQLINNNVVAIQDLLKNEDVSISVITAYLQPYAEKEANSDVKTATNLIALLNDINQSTKNKNFDENKLSELNAKKGLLRDFFKQYGYELADTKEMQLANNIFVAVDAMSLDLEDIKEADQNAKYVQDIAQTELNRANIQSNINDLVSLNAQYSKDPAHSDLSRLEHLDEEISSLETKKEALEKEIKDGNEFIRKGVEGVKESIQKDVNTLDNNPGILQSQKEIATIDTVLKEYAENGKADQLFKLLQEKSGILKQYMDAKDAADKLVQENKEILEKYAELKKSCSDAAMKFGKNDTPEIYKERGENIIAGYTQLRTLAAHMSLRTVEGSTRPVTIKDVLRDENTYVGYINDYKQAKNLIQNFDSKGDFALNFAAIEELGADFEKLDLNFFLNEYGERIQEKGVAYIKRSEELEQYQNNLKAIQDIEKKYKNVLEASSKLPEIEKGLKDQQQMINKMVNVGAESRKKILNTLSKKVDDSITLSHTAFAEKLNEWKKDALENIENIKKSKEYTDVVERIEKNHKLIDPQALNKYKVSLEEKTKSLKETTKQLEQAKTLNKAKNAIMEKITKQVASENKVAEKISKAYSNNKYQVLCDRLKEYQSQLGDIAKGSKNSKAFEDMSKSLNDAITELSKEKPDKNLVDAAIGSLNSDAFNYIKEKNKQIRPFASSLRKLRLNVANNLYDFSLKYKTDHTQNLYLMKEENENNIKEISDYKLNYATGEKQLFDDLAEGAKKHYEENPILPKAEAEINKDEGIDLENLSVDEIYDQSQNIKEKVSNINADLLFDDDEDEIDLNRSFTDIDDKQIREEDPKTAELIRKIEEGKRISDKQRALNNLKLTRNKLFNFDTFSNDYKDYTIALMHPNDEKYSLTNPDSTYVKIESNAFLRGTISKHEFAVFCYCEMMTDLIEGNNIDEKDLLKVTDPEKIDQMADLMANKDCYKQYIKGHMECPAPDKNGRLGDPAQNGYMRHSTSYVHLQLQKYMGPALKEFNENSKIVTTDNIEKNAKQEVKEAPVFSVFK